VALHEAAHAAAAWVLRGQVGAVSIRRSKRWAGVAAVSGPRHSGGTVDVEQPPILWPADVRHALECDAVICLAGIAAEAMLAPPVTGYVPTSEDEQQAKRVARELSPSDQHFLARGNIDEVAGSTDNEKAAAAAHVLAGQHVSACLGWLRHQTVWLVTTNRFRRLVDALVPALLEHTDLGAATVRRILKEADKEAPA
jgi:hypothetical protein